MKTILWSLMIACLLGSIYFNYKAAQNWQKVFELKAGIRYE